MQPSETDRIAGPLVALWERVLAGRIVAIVRLRTEAALVEVAEALVRGGITCLEFTMTSPGSVEAIKACRIRLGDRAVVGAGTVITVEAVERCIAAGAQFVVSPGTDLGVIRATRNLGALSMPGAMTPTEILMAWNAGAHAVKVFPARSLGPRYIADVLAPLPNIALIPTGGVDASNAADYLAAGAVAVGVGGNLVSAQSVLAQDWAAIEEKARELVEAVGARSQKV